ncbi:putative ABC transporter ATP-binding protein [bioreactor metagenome]|uniref:Putative ABC transporter ATP-binding protein n=1 Tax=bioreactor metagenome TaxID=1076179 RepID=A0A645IM91_9ZZZZ
MSREGNRPRGPMGGHAMGGPVEKAKDFKGTMRTLMSYLAEYKLSIIIVFIFAIGSVTFSVIGPKILGKATTEIFNGLVGKVSGEGTGIDFEAIKRILIALVILYIVSAVFSFVQGYVMSSISQKVAYNLRDELVKKINRLLSQE